VANTNKILFTFFLSSMLVACGGGGDDGSSPAPPPPAPPAQRVTFSGSQSRTVLPAGSVAYSVSPALAANEQAVCSVDGTVTPCAAGSSANGQVPYTGLLPGSHALRVEIRAADGTAAARADRTVEVTSAKVVIYGGTPGGVTAALAAARAGQTVALLEPTKWIGGMMSGGLAKTDVGNRGAEVISGLAIEVFEKIRAVEATRGVCSAPCAGLFDFEPQAAERALEEMLAKDQIIVEREAPLVEARKDGAALRSVVTARGEVMGQVFIDASYEGDLIAAAGVPFELGREARITAAAGDAAQLALQEDDAGTPRYAVPRGVYVEPYLVPGDPASGTLPYVEPKPAPIPTVGSGDSRVMAYTYRLCVTDDPTNRIPFAAPAGYDPANYEAHGRLADGMVQQRGLDLGTILFNPAATVRSVDRGYSKYDLNGGSTFSIDMTGPDLNQAYVLGDETARERIRQAYQSYIRGMLYFWQTDPRLRNLNPKIARFGYCKDEFADRGGWPHQLYVRAARRMVGEYVMNENDVLQNGRRPGIADPIGFGAYNMDVHTVRYHVAPVNWPDGSRRDALVNEGFLTVLQPNDAPYPVSYRIIVPRADAATNLLSPVAVSATHMAYSALRMEPTYMMMGQAAGMAAALAIETQQSVQAVSYSSLRQRLLNGGQKLP
jgi:NADPH-dependent 2,4-dienoyl-CoA reductase/sulfur reductase-like enzyme